MAPAPALLPCPFCGSAGQILKSSQYGNFAVQCEGATCYVAIGYGLDRDGDEDHFFNTMDEAVQAWNRRA